MQAIIAIIVILFILLLIWVFCVRRIGPIDKRYIKLQEPGDYDSQYNLRNLVRRYDIFHYRQQTTAYFRSKLMAVEPGLLHN